MNQRWFGVISDTHGLLRESALNALQGCSRIIHAGDIGDREILAQLEQIAPVTAIRGNVDTSAWAQSLPETAVFQEEQRALYLIHDVHDLDLDLNVAALDGVISGHSHRPLLEEREGLLYLNPGSAGPRRFDLPVTVARLWLEETGWNAEHLFLETE